MKTARARFVLKATSVYIDVVTFAALLVVYFLYDWKVRRLPAGPRTPGDVACRSRGGTVIQFTHVRAHGRPDARLA
jgi:hypothetical protein